jgi:hypothetical protein
MELEQTLSNSLEVVREVLLAEGFKDTMLQIVKPGQMFGLVKRLNDVWEMHVRGFEDGTLESEIEVSREYFEHLDDRYRKDATNELLSILKQYGIPHQVTGASPDVEVMLQAPESVTPWKPVAVLGALLGVVALLGYLRRKR